VDLLEHLLWLYARYFAMTLAGGAVLALVGWLVLCLVGWCRKRGFWPGGRVD